MNRTVFLFLFAVFGVLLSGAGGCRHVAPAPAPSEAFTNQPPPEESAQQVPPAASAEDEEEVYRQLRLLSRVMLVIRRDYVDEAKTGYKDLIHQALAGMLQALDPHSQFLEPEAYQGIRDETQGEFGGVGIVIGVRDGVLTVIAPVEDTPAFRAGIHAGDKIIEIDGQKTEAFSVQDAVKRLRGEKGTSVRVRILRDRETLEFTLVRDTIKLTSVKGARMLEDGIGYLRITQFSEPTADELDEALKKLSGQGLRALVIDLRNNPGGLLSSALAVSERFLQKGDVIVATRGRGLKDRQGPVRARRRGTYAELPLAVLINRGTASAAEILAGALQDHRRGILAGETSFGKGSVQSVIPMDDGTALRLTTAMYYTPGGRLIHEKGLEPDIAAPLTTAEWQKVLMRRAQEETPDPTRKEPPEAEGAEAVDVPLERAVDALKGILIYRQGRSAPTGETR